MDWPGYLIVAVVAAVLLFNLLPLFRAWTARGRAVPGLEAMLSGDQHRVPRVLVYFWGPSCGVCRGMTPVIDRMATEGGNVVKVNVAEHPGLARQFGVMATPSLAVVEGGVIRRLVVGGRGEPQIRALLQD